MSNRDNKSFTMDTDGVDHVNISPKGKTRLGRLLATFADVPVTHPDLGRFRTAEGLRCYLLTGSKYDEFRSMSGIEAFEFQSSLPKVWDPSYQEKMYVGLRNKVEEKEELLAAFLENTLPFANYLLHNGKTIHVKSKTVASIEKLHGELCSKYNV